ncbi:MAG: hypothetical protein U0790_03430 [Isosphaeraceae bacterium]
MNDAAADSPSADLEHSTMPSRLIILGSQVPPPPWLTTLQIKDLIDVTNFEVIGIERPSIVDSIVQEHVQLSALQPYVEGKGEIVAFNAQYRRGVFTCQPGALGVLITLDGLGLNANYNMQLRVDSWPNLNGGPGSFSLYKFALFGHPYRFTIPATGQGQLLPVFLSKKYLKENLDGNSITLVLQADCTWSFHDLSVVRL